LRAGAKVIEEEAKRRVPVGSGALRDSIRVSLRSKRGVIQALVKAGNRKPKIGKTSTGRDVYLNPWYAHLVEYGTARHWIKPKNRKSLFLAGLARELVDHPGAKPKPFMRPAFDAKSQAAIDAMAAYMAARMPREVKKFLKS
jgi:HK97 gp10 family phage protein